MNLFVMIDVHRCWRHVDVTQRRTSVDFAERMRELVDVHYPTADIVRVVLDNLSTHSKAALYEAFEPEEARRIARRIEFHFVPKHASWLNMAEIEIGVLRGQCLDRRIEDVDSLKVEIAAWETARNAANATIEWTFTTEKAREKMQRLYPTPSPAADALANGPATATPAEEHDVEAAADLAGALNGPNPADRAIPGPLPEPSVLAGAIRRAQPPANPVADNSENTQQAPSPATPRATALKKPVPRRLRSTFKARPTIPKPPRKAAVESVKITVQSY